MSENKSITYIINESEITVCEDSNASVKTYGITCMQGNEVIEKIDDICIDRAKLSVFVSYINDIRLSPENLRDRVEMSMDDFITEK